MNNLCKFVNLNKYKLITTTNCIRHSKHGICTSLSFWSSNKSDDGDKYWLLRYDYNPENLVERRAPIRPIHLALAKEYASQGKLLFGGAFADPIDGAAIMFKGTLEDVQEFVRKDPYVTKGIATGYNIRQWTVVVGAFLAETKSPGLE